jgi:eukaryotic-like serine/threonine-protein kinase
MAPEQCRGAGGVDHRADQYALGCVLFQMLCGRPPFVAEGIGDVLAMHICQPAPRAGSLMSGIPDDVEALLARCLAKAPADRFSGMGELAAALAGIAVRYGGQERPVGGVAIAAMPTFAVGVSVPGGVVPTTLGLAAGVHGATAPPRLDRPRRGPAAMAAAIGIALAASLGSGGLLLRGRSEPTAASALPAVSTPPDAPPDAMEADAAPDAATIEEAIIEEAPIDAAPSPAPSTSRSPGRRRGTPKARPEDLYVKP